LASVDAQQVFELKKLFEHNFKRMIKTRTRLKLEKLGVKGAKADVAVSSAQMFINLIINRIHSLSKRVCAIMKTT
jgi:hypothetical protein